MGSGAFLDVSDAGAFIYKFVAAVPRPLRVVLWGPLQAKELGFADWTYQDGGETGFVYHSTGRAVKMGTAAATLTYVRRAERAYLTLYLGGYPSDAPREQRLIDVRGLVTEAELFLSKLAQEPLRLELADERALLEPATPVAAVPARTAPAAARRPASRGVPWEV